MQKKQAIYWWRNDLRVKDNASLVQASKFDGDLIHVFFWDDAWDRNTEVNFPRMSDKRKAFLSQSLLSLKNALEAYGAELHVLSGSLKTSILKLHKEYPFDKVYAEKGISWEEEQEELLMKMLTEAELILIDKNSLIPEEQLPFKIDELPDIFSSYRKKVEKQAEVPDLIPAPENLPRSPEIKLNTMLLASELQQDERSAFPFQGGIESAEKRLYDYIWQSQQIASYKKTRNGLIGTDYSSKFSPFLALGSISARQIYWEVKAFEQEVKKNSSTYWLVFELLWRDFFRCVSRKFGRTIFYSGGIKYGSKKWLKNTAIFDRWRKAETGDPFVDANMKELELSGFMSNRGRQNVASYLVHDLGIDWRWGAMWFEHCLLDYDPQSNWGNWMYIAGVGNDPRENRKFNTSLQAERYDPNNEFQKRWLND